MKKIYLILTVILLSAACNQQASKTPETKSTTLKVVDSPDYTISEPVKETGTSTTTSNKNNFQKKLPNPTQTEPAQQPIYNAPVNQPTNSYSAQQDCLNQGLAMVNAEENKQPNPLTLTNQRNAFLKALYSNKSDITADEWTALSASQQNVINSGDKKAMESEIDKISVAQKTIDQHMNNLSNTLYTVRLICGTVSEQEQVVHALQQIQQSLEK